MPTRRDTLRLAAALAGAHAAPCAVPPAEAARLLDRPDDGATDRGRAGNDDDHGDDTLDSVRFAANVDATDWQDRFELGAAEEMAAYRRALHDLLDAHPALAEAYGGAGVSAIDVLDEAAGSLWVRSYLSDVRAGAAYEHLRLALVAPRSSCARCHANGRLWNGSPNRVNGALTETCPDCGGTGTVPTPPPTLAVP